MLTKLHLEDWACRVRVSLAATPPHEVNGGEDAAPHILGLASWSSVPKRSWVWVHLGRCRQDGSCPYEVLGHEVAHIAFAATWPGKKKPHHKAAHALIEGIGVVLAECVKAVAVGKDNILHIRRLKE